MKPNFIGVGAQKCASTWVHRLLEDHPEAWTPSPKELDFFSLWYDCGFQWYERHFAIAEASKLIGEISPSYFHSLAAPGRAKAYNPDFKIILTLRDPVERAYSNHLHEIKIKRFQGDDLSFEAGLKNNPLYLEQGRYATHLKRWMEQFPKDQILVILLEEIAEDAEPQARRLHQFLGIDPDHRSSWLTDKANKSVSIRNEALDRALKFAGQTGRALGAGLMVDAIKRASPIKRMRELNTVDLRADIPPPKPETIAGLEQALYQEMIEMADLLERNSLPWRTWRRATKEAKSGAGNAPTATPSV